MEQDAIQIESALDNDSDSDPIVVASENLCKIAIAESASMFIGKPLEHLSDKKGKSLLTELFKMPQGVKALLKIIDS